MSKTATQIDFDMHLQNELSLQDSTYPDFFAHITLKAAQEIGRGVALSQKELETLRLAAWLYDID